MPFYRYKARNRDKHVISDIIEAVNKGDAVRKIKNNDLVPIEVNEIKLSLFRRGKDIHITSGVSKVDLVFFLSQFYNLLHAGLSIIDSLKIIIDQSTNKYLKKYLIEVLQDLRNGSTLYKAMSKHKKAFPKLMVEMIKVGETVGKLKEVVFDLHIYYKKQVKTVNDIKSAMIYPVVLFMATIGVSLFLLIKVIPQFQTIFKESGKELPFITKLVLSTSKFLQNQFLLLILFSLLFIILLLIFNKTKKGKMFFSNLFLKIPLLRNINRKGNLVKIARTYATLLNNSVNAVDALEITKNILTNQVYVQIIDKAQQNVQNGIPINIAFEKQWSIDPVFTSMMTIGEETATLGEMLSNIAEYYDNELEAQVEKLKKMLEPIIIIVLVVIVGTLVLSIMLPMFKLLEITN